MQNKYREAKPQNKRTKNVVDQSIQRLPVEIILMIFDYLSPRQLCECSCVCKQWNIIASSNEVWRKVFHYYHINRPAKENITFKQEYIKRTKEFMREKLLKDIDNRNRQHMFPDFSELRRLDVSVVGDIFDCKGRLLDRNSKRIKSIISDSNTGVRFHWQKLINTGQFPKLTDIASITITILIPGLIKNLVPIQETINHNVRMNKFDLRESIRMIRSYDCDCQQYCHQLSSPIEWHFCIPTFLLGLWPSDQSVAYLCCFLSLMDMQAITEKLLFGGRQDAKNSLRECKVTEPKLLRFSQPNCTTEFKCTLSIENIDPSERLLLNCWRSVDYSEDQSFNLIQENEASTHLTMNDNIKFRPYIGRERLKYKNIIKVEVLIVSARNFPLWSYSTAVVLSSTKNVDDYMCPNTQWQFEDAVIAGTLSTDNSGRLYLTHFCIR